MEPGNRQPAPGRLALVQNFVNTKDVLEQRETFLSPDLLERWLKDHTLIIHPTLREEDVVKACKFREALRALLRQNNGLALPLTALETLNQTARNAQFGLQFYQDGRVHLYSQAPGLDGALGALLVPVFTAMQDGTWQRLKACRNEKCQWIYYDTSKNLSGAWCSMSICGNRNKAWRYRQRRQASES